jgi:hypothetical protein
LISVVGVVRYHAKGGLLMKSILSCFVFLLASAGTLAAQSNLPLMAQVPFPFFAGNTPMPAGEYRFAFLEADRSVIVVKPTERTKGAFVGSIRADAKGQVGADSLLFYRYPDNRHFLRQIVHGRVAIANETLKSRTERESVTTTLHASNYPTNVVIVARAR